MSNKCSPVFLSNVTRAWDAITTSVLFNTKISFIQIHKFWKNRTDHTHKLLLLHPAFRTAVIRYSTGLHKKHCPCLILEIRYCSPVNGCKCRIEATTLTGC